MHGQCSRYESSSKFIPYETSKVAQVVSKNVHKMQDLSGRPGIIPNRYEVDIEHEETMSRQFA